MQRTRDHAKQQGFVETVFDRRLWLPEINASNGMKRIRFLLNLEKVVVHESHEKHEQIQRASCC